MSWWKFWRGDDEGADGSVDYYAEGVELAEDGRYHEALTSFRLALKESQDEPAALEQMAVVYTRIGMTDEAIRTYRRVLEAAPRSPAANYGLAFLLLKRGQEEEAAKHLRIFLAGAPDDAEAEEHVEHAWETLERLEGEGAPPEDRAEAEEEEKARPEAQEEVRTDE